MSKPSDDSPFFPLFFEKESFHSRIPTPFSSFHHLQTELLGYTRNLSLNLYRPVPVGVLDLIEVSEISFDSIPKAGKVFLFVLISLGDTGKIQGEVPVPQSLFPSIQDLLNFLFFRCLAGKKNETDQAK